MFADTLPFAFLSILSALVLVPVPAPQGAGDTTMRTTMYDDCVIDVQPIVRRAMPTTHVWYQEVMMIPATATAPATPGGVEFTIDVAKATTVTIGDVQGGQGTDLKPDASSKITVRHVPFPTDPTRDRLSITITPPANADGSLPAPVEITRAPVRGRYDPDFGLITEPRLENFPVYNVLNKSRYRLWVNYYGLETSFSISKVH